MRRTAAGLALALTLLVGACSSDDEGATADGGTAEQADTTTTTSATATTTTAAGGAAGGGATTDDRGAPSVEQVGAALEPAACDALFAVLEAMSLPVEGDADREAQLAEVQSTLEAGAAADPTYPAQVIAFFEAVIEEEREVLVEEGYVGWLESLAERRGTDADVESEIRNLRQYVEPRC